MMSTDIYAQIVNTPPGQMLAKQLGLPRPVKLERYRPGAPAIAGPVLTGQAPEGRLADAIAEALQEIGAEQAAPGEAPVKALVFDATGIAASDGLVELQRFFHPNVRRIEPCGRIVVLGAPPEGLPPRAATAQRALEGFTRSLAKEIGRGVTVQLVYVAQGAEGEIGSTLR